MKKQHLYTEWKTKTERKKYDKKKKKSTLNECMRLLLNTKCRRKRKQIQMNCSKQVNVLPWLKNDIYIYTPVSVYIYISKYHIHLSNYCNPFNVSKLLLQISLHFLISFSVRRWISSSITLLVRIHRMNPKHFSRIFSPLCNDIKSYTSIYIYNQRVHNYWCVCVCTAK